MRGLSSGEGRGREGVKGRARPTMPVHGADARHMLGGCCLVYVMCPLGACDVPAWFMRCARVVHTMGLLGSCDVQPQARIGQRGSVPWHCTPPCKCENTRERASSMGQKRAWGKGCCCREHNGDTRTSMHTPLRLLMGMVLRAQAPTRAALCLSARTRQLAVLGMLHGAEDALEACGMVLRIRAHTPASALGHAARC